MHTEDLCFASNSVLLCQFQMTLVHVAIMTRPAGESGRWASPGLRAQPHSHKDGWQLLVKSPGKILLFIPQIC